MKCFNCIKNFIKINIYMLLLIVFARTDFSEQHLIETKQEQISLSNISLKPNKSRFLWATSHWNQTRTDFSEQHLIETKQEQISLSNISLKPDKNRFLWATSHWNQTWDVRWDEKSFSSKTYQGFVKTISV
jgi:acyl carrier protein phosphodiesterase